MIKTTLFLLACFAPVLAGLGETVSIVDPPYNASRYSSSISSRQTNSTAFQTAINDCTANGNKLYVPKGDYYFSAGTQLVVNGRMELECENQAALIFKNSSAIPAIRITGSNPLNLGSFKFGAIKNSDDQGFIGQGYGIQLQNCAAVDLHVKYMAGWYRAIFLYAGASQNTRENKIFLQTVDYCYFGIIATTSAGNISCNYLTWSVIGEGANGLYLYAGSGGGINFNRFEGESIWMESPGSCISGNADNGNIALIKGNRFDIPLVTKRYPQGGGVLIGGNSGYLFCGTKNTFAVGLSDASWYVDTTKNKVDPTLLY